MAAIEEGNVLYKLVASEILRFVKVEDRAKAADWFIRVWQLLFSLAPTGLS